MLDPHRDHFTFAEFALHWAREQGQTYSEQEILEELVAAFWRNEFNSGRLGWNERLAALDLYPDEPYDPDEVDETPSYSLSEAIWEDDGGEVRVTPRRNPPSDFRPMNRQIAFTTLGFVDASLALDSTDMDGNPKYLQLSEMKFSRFSSKVQTVLRNIAVTKEELRRWCEARQITPPRFVGTEDDGEWSKESTGEEEPSIAHVEVARLRGELLRWIERKARAPEAKDWIKADFLKHAREEVNPGITKHLFNEVWRTAEIPADFRKAGVRPTRLK